jgi:ELWxxDGT repeat protein
VLNNQLIFSANDGVNFSEPWVSGGTPETTSLLLNINPTSDSTVPASFTSVGGRVFFVANDSFTGAELWVTDGTPAGTTMVYDFYAGWPSGANGMPTLVNGQLIEAGFSAEWGNELFAVDDLYAPKLWQTSFDDQVQRVIKYRFSEDVSSTLSADQFTVQNLTTGQFYQSPQLVLNYNAATNEALLSPTSGAWPDGNYQVTFDGSAVTDRAGNGLINSDSLDFSVLTADGDGNHVVDILDFNLLAKNFGKTGQTLSGGNYDYSPDGTVDILDFNILATHFGNHLDPPASVETASISTSRFIAVPTSTSTFAGWSKDSLEQKDLVLDISAV